MATTSLKECFRVRRHLTQVDLSAVLLIFLSSVLSVAAENQESTICDRFRNRQESLPYVPSTSAPECEHEIYLPNPEVPGEFVDFDACLNNAAEGRYVFKVVNETGLAHFAGFMSGDVLLEVNGTSIEGLGIENILQLLRNLGQPNVFLTIKRDLEEHVRYIWTIFEVVIEDGVPGIQVIQSVENSEFDMPEIYTGDDRYSWVKEAELEKYDVFFDSKKQLFLTIKGGNLVFDNTYDPVYSSFYLYKYMRSDGLDPGRGNVIALSLKPLHKPPVSQQNTPSGNADGDLEVLDFPPYMTRSDIPPDPRFWYIKHFNNGFTLESMKKKGLYLGVGTGPDYKAVLSTEKTELSYAKSSKPPHCGYN